MRSQWGKAHKNSTGNTINQNNDKMVAEIEINHKTSQIYNKISAGVYIPRQCKMIIYIIILLYQLLYALYIIIQ